MAKRVAVIGTAPTWQESPWDDRGVEMWTLNDAYALGFPRIDVHFEMHPLNRFLLRKPTEKVSAADVPRGYYVRPEGHLQWLETFAKERPLWLQGEAPSGWTHARPYPRASIEQEFKTLLFPDPSWSKPYVACGPAWMVLLALSQGLDELYVTGIHLATDREYADQRPNFEYLMGYCLGRGIDVHLPPRTPLCKAPLVYCYEPRLTTEQDKIRYQIQKVDARRSTVVGELVNRKPWTRAAPKRHELRRLEAERAELARELSRVSFHDQLSRPEWRVS